MLNIMKTTEATKVVPAGLPSEFATALKACYAYFTVETAAYDHGTHIGSYTQDLTYTYMFATNMQVSHWRPRSEFIHTSVAKNGIGDKDCSHFQWTGTVTVIPSELALSYNVNCWRTVGPESNQGKRFNWAQTALDEQPDWYRSKNGNPLGLIRIPPSAMMAKSGYTSYFGLRLKGFIPLSLAEDSKAPRNALSGSETPENPQFCKRIESTTWDPYPWIKCLDSAKYGPSDGYLKWSAKLDGRARIERKTAGYWDTTTRFENPSWFVSEARLTASGDIQVRGATSRTALPDISSTAWQTLPPETLRTVGSSSSAGLTELDAYLDIQAAPFNQVDWRALIEPFKAELTREAIDNCRYLDINSVAYIRDLRDAWRSVQPIIQLLKRPLSGKAWANAWLTYRYGIRLTILDTKAIVEAIQRFLKEAGPSVKGRATKSVQTSVDGIPGLLTCHCKVVGATSCRGLQRILDMLRQWDMLISYKNMWDFIPYSFVADWFIPIGDMLADLDRATDADLYKLESVVWSVKFTGPLTTALPSGLAGNVGFSRYERWIEDGSELTSSFTVPSIDSDDGVNVTHLVDGFALAIQRWRRRR